MFAGLREFVEKLGEGAGVKGYVGSLIKREFYMETFGIGNLDDRNNPLALVTTNPQEGLYPLWPWFQKARRFILYEMGKSLNCSLFEFLDQPTWIVDGLLDEFAEKHLRQIKAAQKAEENARRAGKQADTNLRRPFGGLDAFD